MRMLHLIAILFASPNLIAAVGPISLKSLAQQSEFIVRGQVASVHYAVTKLPRNTVTTQEIERAVTGVAEVAVDYVIKGKNFVGVIKIVFARNEDAPRFAQGERIIVFLQETNEVDTYAVVGFAQGKYSVADDVVKPGDTPVHEFIAQVRQVVASPDR